VFFSTRGGRVLALLLLLLPGSALAKRVVVADLYGEPDVRAEAGSITLLLRSLLATGDYKILSRQELLSGVQKVTGKTPQYALMVKPPQYQALLKQLSADFLVSGWLNRAGSHLESMVRVSDSSGTLIGAVSARVPHGSTRALTLKLATDLARTLGIKIRKADLPSLAKVRPFHQASVNLMEQAPARGVLALQSAEFRLAKSVPSTQEVTRMVSGSTKLSPDDRLRAALFGGSLDDARRLADAALAKQPKSQVARAAKAYALLLQDKTAEARKELKALRSSKEPLALLARAAMAQQSNKARARDAALRRLLSKPCFIPALRMVAGLPPGELASKLENAVFNAAVLHAKEHPGLASQLGLRAARGGVQVKEALRLIRITDLDAAELKAIQPILDKAIQSGWGPGFRLRGELRLKENKIAEAKKDFQRALSLEKDDPRTNLLHAYILSEKGDHKGAAKAYALALADGTVATRWSYARELELAGDKAKAKKVRELLLSDGIFKEAVELRLDQTLGAQAKDLKASQVRLTEERLIQLTKELTPMLESFTSLKQANTVLLAPLAGSQHWPFWPLLIQTGALHRGLRHTLRQPDFGMFVVESPAQPVSKMSTANLSNLASRAGADGLLLYKMRSTGTKILINLVYFHLASSKAYAVDNSLDGLALGLLIWSDYYKYGGMGLSFLLICWIAFGLIRGTGEVRVKVKMDPGARMNIFTLEINRNKTPPELKDPAKYTDQLTRVGTKSKRFKITMIPAISNFRRIPTGKWYVHLYGTYRKSGELHSLPRTLTEEIKVSSRKLFTVEFNLEPKNVEYRVSMYDGNNPKAGVMLWLNEDDGHRVITDRNGAAVIMVPRNVEHTLHFKHGKFHSQRTLQFSDTKIHSGNINLLRERMFADVEKTRIEMDDEAFVPMREETVDLESSGPPGIVPIGDDPFAPPKDGRFAPPKDDPFAPPEDGRFAPPKDDPFTPPEDDSFAPPKDDLFAPPGPDDAFQQPQTVALPEGVEALKLKTLPFGGDTPEANSSPSPSGPMPAMSAGASSDASSLTGLQRYKQIKELGRGAMGVVHLAKDLVLERDVALKIIGPELRQYPDVYEMFIQEAKAMAALNHPNLVMIFDQGQDENETFVVMEYVEGNTLESLISNKGRPSLKRGLNVADQLCTGLAFAHKRQILHRDIKPENIFISKQGRVKLGDFGLARAMNELSIRQTKVRGTPQYMAPEQIRGTDIDFRADLYSVGCTFYTIFTGRPPFIEGEVLYHHLHTDPPAPSELVSGLPPELDALLLSCVEKEKEKRPASAKDIRLALKPLIVNNK